MTEIVSFCKLTRGHSSFLDQFCASKSSSLLLHNLICSQTFWGPSFQTVFSFPTNIGNRWVELPISLHLTIWVIRYNLRKLQTLNSLHLSRLIQFSSVVQSCPTLCNPIDGSPPGSTVPGILQARTLEWLAISFSNAWKWKVKVKSLSHVPPSETP